MNRIFCLVILAAVPVSAQETTMMEWVNTLHDFGLHNKTYPGIRQSATKSGQLATKWLQAEFRELGFEEVHREAFPMNTWEAKMVSLEILDEEKWVKEECWPIWFTRFSENPLSGPLMVWDPTLPIERFDGSIVLFEFEKTTREHVRSHSFDMSAYERISKSGASAAVMAFSGFEKTRVFMNVGDLGADAFTGRMGAVPAVSIEPGRMKRLIEQSRTGCMARVTVGGRAPVARGYNVVAALPGSTDKVILFSAHSDGGAVQGGSGVAMLLELARHYQKKSGEDGPLSHTLVFLVHAGHYMGEMGLENFIRRHDEQYAGRMVLHARLGYFGKETASTDYSARLALNINLGMTDAQRKRIRDLGKTLKMSASFAELDGTAYPLKRVPVFQVDSSYSYGQTTDDTPDKINSVGLAIQAELMKDVVEFFEK